MRFSRIGAAGLIGALTVWALACGLSVEGSTEPVTGNPETGASLDGPGADTSTLAADAGKDDPNDASSSSADADASEPLTGFCATHPNAFLCDDFDRGTLNKWDGIQTTNGNTVALSTAQSKTQPSSVLVTTFDSPTSDGGPTATCDKAALYKIFTLDFQEAELSFDIYPTSATGRSAVATLFMSDNYQIEIAPGTNAFIQESESPTTKTQTPFSGDLPANTWTRITIRYSRTPSKLSILYDNILKHEKALASASYTINHRLYLGDFCAIQSRTFHLDNVAFDKLR